VLQLVAWFGENLKSFSTNDQLTRKLWEVGGREERGNRRQV